MSRLLHNSAKPVLRAISPFHCIVRRQSPFLMFALGLMSAVIIGRVWDGFEPDRRPEPLLGIKGLHPNIAPLPGVARTSGDGVTKPVLVLEGVNGEAAPVGFSGARSVDAMLQTAQVETPRTFQVGEMLRLVADTGAVFHVRVSRRAALCSTDLELQPVDDVQLVECGDLDRAHQKQWRYIIETVSEPAPAPVSGRTL
jgi:hypothetical protein